MVFKIADESGLLLLDLKDLRAMLQYVADNADQFKTQYGNVSAASAGAIQRNLARTRNARRRQIFRRTGAESRRSDPDAERQRRHQHSGRRKADAAIAEGLRDVSCFGCSRNFSKIFPKSAIPINRSSFSFSTKRICFSPTSKSRSKQKIEQMVRLIRSKGVGVYFVSQNPLDIPDVVLGQLGNRVQHALRAFTPRDQKAVTAAAQTFRQNPELNVETVLTELSSGRSAGIDAG